MDYSINLYNCVQIRKLKTITDSLEKVWKGANCKFKPVAITINSCCNYDRDEMDKVSVSVELEKVSHLKQIVGETQVEKTENKIWLFTADLSKYDIDESIININFVIMLKDEIKEKITL